MSSAMAIVCAREARVVPHIRWKNVNKIIQRIQSAFTPMMARFSSTTQMHCTACSIGCEPLVCLRAAHFGTLFRCSIAHLCTRILCVAVHVSHLRNASLFGCANLHRWRLKASQMYCASPNSYAFSTIHGILFAYMPAVVHCSQLCIMSVPGSNASLTRCWAPAV